MSIESNPANSHDARVSHATGDLKSYTTELLYDWTLGACATYNVLQILSIYAQNPATSLRMKRNREWSIRARNKSHRV